jgi:hypothetical protein
VLNPETASLKLKWLLNPETASLKLKWVLNPETASLKLKWVLSAETGFQKQGDVNGTDRKDPGIRDHFP